MSAQSSPAAQAPIAITQGDPAGIGGEIIAKAFRISPQCTAGCFVVGDLPHMVRASRVSTRPGEVPLTVAVIERPSDAAGVPPNCIPLLQVSTGTAVVDWGKVDAAAGRMAADAVVWGARAALRGDVSALVTAPLHKEALSAAGVLFPGHTELLQAQAAAHLGTSVEHLPVRMMLANDELRTVLVSIHVPLRQAIEAVTVDNVLETIRIAHQSLSRMLGRRPRIAVAGLNPHAGEGGLFGSEERLSIEPAVQAAVAEAIEVSGPYAPDTVFMRARGTGERAGEFDAVVAMYHDQGLIPVKYLGVDKGVNVTLGLPFVRTSPDHGTAFDIAGTGRADPSSLLAAIRMARQLMGAR